jgi:hypothetical protein
MAQTHFIKSSWPGACASVSMLNRQPDAAPAGLKRACSCDYQGQWGQVGAF